MLTRTESITAIEFHFSLLTSQFKPLSCNIPYHVPLLIFPFHFIGVSTVAIHFTVQYGITVYCSLQYNASQTCKLSCGKILKRKAIYVGIGFEEK